MISIRSLVPSAAALAVLIPATAKATIVPGKSISGVSVTATRDELVDELGNFSRREVGEESADYGLFWSKRRFHALVVLRSQGPDTSFTISRGRAIEVTIDSTE